MPTSTKSNKGIHAVYASNCKDGEGFVVLSETRITADRAERVYLRWIEHGGFGQVVMLRGDEVVSRHQSDEWHIREYDFGSVSL